MPVALDVEGTILGGYRLAGVKHLTQERLKVVPEFAPILLCRSTEGLGVPQSNARRISLIVKCREGRPPEKDDLRLRRQHDIDCSPETVRP